MRRDAFVAEVIPHLSPIVGLPVVQLRLGDALVLWAAAPSAPIDTHSTDDGGAVVWGDALLPGAARRSRASALLEAWSGPTATGTCHDGFFAALAVRDGRIVVGGDLLGLFPLYVSAPTGVFLAASSPAPLARHPLVDSSTDIEGLIGHLLTGGPFDGRTLQRGVHRMAAGTRVTWSASAGLRTHRAFEWPHPPVDDTLTFNEQMERFDAAQGAAVRRHTGVHERLAVLLSGGRDSRLLAGYLTQQGRTASAVSLGAVTDHDARCAAAVARTLRLPHRVHDVTFDRFVAFADRTVRWERLSGGLSSMHAWATVDALEAPGGGVGGGVLSGYVLEARHLAPLPPTRDAMLQWTHARALTPESLERLLRPQFHGALAGVMASVRDSFGAPARGHSLDGAELSWRWLMAGYARFHAGAVPWRMSFASWPILPILDQALLETTLSIPRSFLADRRMQDAVLRSRFPELARLPLDRNAHDVRPLVESWKSRLGRHVQRILPDRSRPSPERRYYARMYDFDNPGWRAIRESAQPGRAALHEWFDEEALAALVPPSGVASGHDEPITNGFGPKMLTGLMRWQVLAQEGDA